MAPLSDTSTLMGAGGSLEQSSRARFWQVRCSSAEGPSAGGPPPPVPVLLLLWLEPSAWLFSLAFRAALRLGSSCMPRTY